MFKHTFVVCHLHSLLAKPIRIMASYLLVLPFILTELPSNAMFLQKVDLTSIMSKGKAGKTFLQQKLQPITIASAQLHILY